MVDQPVGPILDGLGVTIYLDDGDLVESAVVIVKTITASGDIGIDVLNSAGMDWISQLGLVTAATQVINDHPFDCRGDQ